MRRDNSIPATSLINFFATGAGNFSSSALNPGVYQITDNSGTGFSAIVGNGTESDFAPPQAYLNLYFLDKYKDPTTVKAVVSKVDESAAITPETINNAHQMLSLEYEVTQPGFVYVNVSHDADENIDVYFDDLYVEHQKGFIVQQTDYFAFGMEFNSMVQDKLTSQNYLYNGKEKLGLTNWLDYGARMYDPSVGRWFVPDPLAEIQMGMTPFRYCYNNPVNYTDPFGLWEQDANGNWSTSDVNDISRFLSYFQTETHALNNNPTMTQINSFIAGEESDGGAGLGRLSDGSKLVSAINVNGYKEGNHINWFTDKKSFDNAWHEIQGDLTPDALDPRTLGHNLLGLSYPGGNNPRKYNGDYDYSYAPVRLSEYPAIGHDRRYDNLKAVGASGLLTDSRTIGADWKFVGEEFAIAAMPIDVKTRVQAFILGLGLGVAATPKTILNFATPQPAAGVNTTMWYSISNQGVTNKPQ